MECDECGKEIKGNIYQAVSCEGYKCCSSKCLKKARERWGEI